MAKKFDLASAIACAVSDIEHTQEQIEYIEIDKIHADAKNFYSLEGIDELAANIELCGLQQPIRVRPSEDGYTIVSGHRRYAAISNVCAVDQPERWNTIACIVEHGEMSEALRELRLIYANSDTRRMTSFDISRQAERVEALLYQLKEEGFEFPGRMRDHVAEACQVSKSKLARLKVIRENLCDKFMEIYKQGGVSEETAYELAKCPEEHQKLIYAGVQKRGDNPRWLYAGSVSRYGKLLSEVCADPCELGAVMCDHVEQRKAHIANDQNNNYVETPCTRCCARCSNLSRCKDACPHLSDKVKVLKEAERDRKAEAKAEQEAKDAPVIASIAKYWARFGEARAAANKSVKEAMGAAQIFYGTGDEERYYNCERGKKLLTTTYLPYGYSFSEYQANKLVAVADLFGCSLDYLFCRTDAPNAVSDSGTIAWRTGTPKKAGKYYCKFNCSGTQICSVSRWEGRWEMIKGLEAEAQCLGWYPLPED